MCYSYCFPLPAMSPLSLTPIKIVRLFAAILARAGISSVPTSMLNVSSPWSYRHTTTFSLPPIQLVYRHYLHAAAILLRNRPHKPRDIPTLWLHAMSCTLLDHALAPRCLYPPAKP